MSEAGADECVFCDIVAGNGNATVLLESDTHLCILDKYPVNEGHALVLPKQHTQSLPESDWESLQSFLQDAIKIVRSEYDPDGLNVGINDGDAAGQTISHLHWHIIPRYDGDIADPTGGVRGVIPERRIYD